ncbi:hypothetical protein CS062_20435 [Roseateles chitinivorans]|uniref:YCII-related domain-containing protein n=1 Tax=Roseateles chitinivorans TaxID=2917965 RepID=A0A2G9C4E2_9BURK|nr:YciI family protein [Roseateles chitinivorans]PIM51310.1 hypothetical protein CS062_20435 [Roseateles chitinivorans]
MLFIVTLTYRTPPARIEEHLGPHRAWLADQTRAGHVLFAGPLDPPTGGLILAHSADRAALDALMATDPFVVHRLVDVAVLAASPALRHADFPARWAAAAKAVEVA